MGFLDAILGRPKPVMPGLDALFAIPAAAEILQAVLGLTPTGTGAVCVKAEGAVGARALLRLDTATGVSISTDEYGFSWITIRPSAIDLSALVTQLHAVNSTLDEAGFGPALVCTNIGFAEPGRHQHRRLGLIYLFQRGTVYPFAPRGAPIRDTALELQVRAELASALPIESDLCRWFPTWNAPVP